VVYTFVNKSLVKITPDNFNQEEQVIPLFCYLCKFSLKTKEDVSSYRRNKCCSLCELKWVAQKKDFNSILWKEYLLLREATNKPTIVFN